MKLEKGKKVINCLDLLKDMKEREWDKVKRVTDAEVD